MYINALDDIPRKELTKPPPGVSIHVISALTLSDGRYYEHKRREAVWHNTGVDEDVDQILEKVAYAYAWQAKVSATLLGSTSLNYSCSNQLYSCQQKHGVNW